MATDVSQKWNYLLLRGYLQGLDSICHHSKTDGKMTGYLKLSAKSSYISGIALIFFSFSSACAVYSE